MSESKVLLLSNSNDVTSDYLQQEMLAAGVQVCRFNTDLDCNDLKTTYSYNEFSLESNSWTLSPNDVNCVIMRRPRAIVMNLPSDVHTKKHVSDEWSEVLESFFTQIDERKWINHPSKNFTASHKIEQLTRATRFGLEVPDTLVTTSPTRAIGFIKSSSYRVIVKPLASGYIERDSLDTVIFTNEITENHDAINLVSGCPVLFQERVEKAYDVRVTCLDDHLSAVALFHKDISGQQKLDVRRDNMMNVEYKKVEMPDGLKAKLLKLLRSYHLRFAAVDFGVTEEGNWFFFEINPNGQWAWLDHYAEAGIADFFISSARALQ